MRITSEEKQSGTLSEPRLAEALRTFRDAGFVVLEDLYDPEWVAAMREAYNRTLQAHLGSIGGPEAAQQSTQERLHLGFYPPVIPPFSDPAHIANPIAVQIMESLLGKDLIASFFFSNTSYPGSGYQNIHRDHGHVFGTELSVAAPVTHIALNMPLCDFTESNGSTEIWPGTQLIVDTDPADGGKLAERVTAFPSMRTNLKIGALVLRDLRTWHRGTPNGTDTPRTMLSIVYRRGWLWDSASMNIPQATWNGWPERAREIFRENRIVENVAEASA